ncbi:MAG TPA: hypothetical protein VFT27_12065 [Actinomycetota bacterium]|nr:hypothetical protein [Actinomycetota bacterium]
MTWQRRAAASGMSPLPPRRKWRAILLASLTLAPAYWSLLMGMVAAATDTAEPEPSAAPLIAFGLAVVPFVFVVLAFLSEHPRAPGAVVWAMLLTLAIGIPVSALAADAVTGLLAGVGAGGIVALRRDTDHTWKARAIAVLMISVWAFLTVRVTPEVVLVLGPALPFTSIGVADQLSERARERDASRHEGAPS